MNIDALKELMLNDNGFAFNPQSGESFQLSPVGVHVIRQLLDHKDEETVLSSIIEEFDVSPDVARRDLGGFILTLSGMSLIKQTA